MPYISLVLVLYFLAARNGQERSSVDGGIIVAIVVVIVALVVVVTSTGGVIVLVICKYHKEQKITFLCKLTITHIIMFSSNLSSEWSAYLCIVSFLSNHFAFAFANRVVNKPKHFYGCV